VKVVKGKLKSGQLIISSFCWKNINQVKLLKRSANIACLTDFCSLCDLYYNFNSVTSSSSSAAAAASSPTSSSSSSSYYY